MNKLVTCVYLGLYNTYKGGRPGAFRDRYIQGILSLKNNTYQKVIYTDQNMSGILLDHLNRNCTEEQIKLYDIKIFDIDKCKYSQDITRLLQDGSNTFPRDRSIHVQWAKFHFLQAESENADQLYWIDAGLISPTLFPKNIIPDNAANVITDTYLNNLIDKVKDKMYVLVGDRHNGFNGPGFRENRYHPVGGFFGGSATAVKNALSQFDQLQSEYINKHKLIFEEAIMETCFYNNMGDYMYDVFDSWYHEDHMIKELAAMKNIKFCRLFE